MIKRNLTRAAAAGFSLTAIALLMSACGDGGGIPASNAGKAVDGYIRDAEIWVDQNPVDGVCETDTKQKTDATGGFSLTGYTEYVVCAKNGTDISTGALFVGELKAPPGATQITPLTTLVQAKVAADKAAGKDTSYADAAKTIATNLGLGDTDILNIDPVSVVGTNPKLAKTTAAVQVLLIQAANNVVAASTGVAVTLAQTNALLGSAIKGLADAIVNAAKPVDLTSDASVTNDVNGLVKTAISNTVTFAQKDSVVVSAVSKIAGIDASNVASVAVAQVLALTQNVAKESAENLVAVRDFTKMPVTLLSQTDTSAAVSIALRSGELTTLIAPSLSSATVAAIAATTKSVSDALIGGNTAAVAAAVAAVNAQNAQVAAEAKITIPLVTVPVYVRPTVSSTTTTTTTTTTTLPTTTTNVFVLSGPKFNGSSVSVTGTSYSTLALSSPLQGSLVSTSLNLTATGSPTISTASVPVGFSVVEVGGNRRLYVAIDKVDVTSSTSGISLIVPKTAVLRSYVVNAAGGTGGTSSVSLTNVGDNVLTSTPGVISVNWEGAISTLSSKAGFTGLNLNKGIFDVSFAIGISNLALQTTSTPFSAGSMSVTIPKFGTDTTLQQLVVTGQGASFRVTVN